mmetsp:Transcript_7650/g.18494  ORF Transcript_7650/g.18494 Transcript_7650/m.18494 type:complete len:733 (+) Transcript_7650:226-2424(+)
MKRQMNTSGQALPQYPAMFEDYNRGMSGYALEEPCVYPADKRILHTTAAMSTLGKSIVDSYLSRERRERERGLLQKRANKRRVTSNLSNAKLAKQKMYGSVWEEFGKKQLSRSDLFQLMNVCINEALHRHHNKKGLRRSFVWKEFNTDNLDYSLKYFFDDIRKNVDWGVKYFSVYRHCDVFMSKEDVLRSAELCGKVKRELEQELYDRERDAKKTPETEFVNEMTATPESKSRLLIINSLPVLGWRPVSQKMNRHDSPAMRTYDDFVRSESRPETKESVRSLFQNPLPNQFPELPPLGKLRQATPIGGSLATSHGGSRLESRPGTVEGVLPKVGSVASGMVVTQRADGITKEGVKGPTGAAMGTMVGVGNSHLLKKSIPGSLTGTTDGLRPGTTPAGRPLTCDAKAGALESVEGLNFPLARPATAMLQTTKGLATKSVSPKFEPITFNRNKAVDWFVVDQLFKTVIKRACYGSKHFQKVWGEYFLEGHLRDHEIAQANKLKEGDAENGKGESADTRSKIEKAFSMMNNPIPRESVKQHVPNCDYGRACNCPNYLIPEGPSYYERAEGAFDLRIAVGMVAALCGNLEVYALIDPNEYVKRDALFGREMTIDEKAGLACCAALGANAELFKLAKPAFLQYHDKVKLSICAALGQAYDVWQLLDAPMMIDYVDQVKVVTAAKIGGHMDLYREVLKSCFLTENDAQMLGEIEYGSGSWILNVGKPPRPGVLLGKKT